MGQVWTLKVDGKDHFNFAKPVRLAIPFDPSRVREGAPVSMSVWQDGRWRAIPGSRVEAGSSQVVADVDHFSEYAPTQDALQNVIDDALEDARKRFLKNEFWYGHVHLSISGSGQQGPSRFRISRGADIRFRVRAEKAELAIFSGYEEVKKRGVTLPPEGELAFEKLRNLRRG